jgi:hypothetical protein
MNAYQYEYTTCPGYVGTLKSRRNCDYCGTNTVLLCIQKYAILRSEIRRGQRLQRAAVRAVPVGHPCQTCAFVAEILVLSVHAANKRRKALWLCRPLTFYSRLCKNAESKPRESFNAPEPLVYCVYLACLERKLQRGRDGHDWGHSRGREGPKSEVQTVGRSELRTVAVRPSFGDVAC